jgi:hypothetical protein
METGLLFIAHPSRLNYYFNSIASVTALFEVLTDLTTIKRVHDYFDGDHT